MFLRGITFYANFINKKVQILLTTQVVKWLEISDRANFGAHSRTGIEFLGSNYNSILQSSFACNCTPISSELSKLVHSKTWHFTLTQPFHRDFWLPVLCSKKYKIWLNNFRLTSITWCVTTRFDLACPCMSASPIRTTPSGWVCWSHLSWCMIRAVLRLSALFS